MGTDSYGKIYTVSKLLIYILHASTGSGHKTAAESIALALNDMDYCPSEVKVLDILDFGVIKFDGNKASNSYTGKLAPIHDISWRYNFTGRINWGGSSYINQLLSNTVFYKLKDLFKNRMPDLVICTHMLAANLAEGIRHSLHTNYPIVSVPTDYETEGMWPHLATDLFCVSSDRMIETLLARRVPKEKILYTGMPVNPLFTKSFKKAESREKFNLPQDKIVALILAGASEPQPYINMRKALDKILPYFAQMDWMHFVFCTGKDEEYKQHLQLQITTDNISVLGFVENMAELMNASDIALCKSGGLTVTECLCAKLPLLIIGRGFAQEHINTRYLTSIGAAYAATTYKEVVDSLCTITSNSVIYDALLANVKNLRKPNAAYDVAKAAVQMAGVEIDGQAEDARRLYENKKKTKSLLGLYIGKSPAHSR